MSKLSNIHQNISIKKVDSKTVNIQIFKNDLLLGIVGQFNQNLNQLEKLTNTKIFFRGNSITAKGNKEDNLLLIEAFKFLVDKFLLTNFIENNDIIMSVNHNRNEKNSNIRSLDNLIKTPKKSVIARSHKQSEYIKALRENDIVMALGPAGTGKSYLAVSVAITMLFEKK